MSYARIFLLSVVGVLIAIFLLSNHNVELAQFKLQITNHQQPIGYVNQGEARGIGAWFSVYSSGDEQHALTTANSGETVQLAPGKYDVKVSYSDGNAGADRWIRDVDIHDRVEQSFELNVDGEQLNNPPHRNAWRP